ncbi:hypothetical protein AB6A40_002054 [Gnathostoma spinigerum]|uniref:CCHC-type domain-containing protein n=1 Tax=Gnathostoma spinigerum TaxID=75299 RepID=A0ABD6EGA8_9BILA
MAETFGDDRNDWNIADLWIRVLRYFAVEHSTEELIGMDYPINVNAAVLDGRWNKKRIAVKDPFVDRLMQPASHFSCYFSNCFMASFLYFAIPRTFKGPLTPYNLVIPRKTLLTKEGEDERIRRKERISAKLRTIAVEDAGQGDENISKDQSGFLEDSLYTEMVEKSDMEDLIRVENLTDLEEENLSESNMTGESMLNDAVLQKSTACSDLLSLDSPEDIDEEASKIYKPLKFYSVCEAEEDINQVIREVVENCVIQAGESTNSKDAVRLRYDRKTLIDLQFYSSSVKLNTQYLEDIGVYHLATSTSIQNCESDDDLKVIKCEFLVELPSLKSMSQTNFLNINPEEFILVWNAEFFSNGTKPDIHCNSCGVSGHLMEECPELQLPKLVPLPSLNGAQRMTLKAIVKVLSSTCSIRRSRIEAMDDLRFTLEKLFQERLRSDSRLTLFGSFGNGFGMKDSDADMCLRFGEDSLSEELDPIQIVRKVAEVLHSVPYIYNIETVVRAKVPIVKFRTLFPIELEADLSLYNELAIQNTRLLQTYCKIDARAKQLGIMVKEWARWCMIGDASRGSLSSYSYVIMVIYYLQRITPPVLPFLQEVSVGEEKPVKIIDGHDVFFHCFSDVNWKSSNMQSAGELWLGFLVFFAEKFDFETEVIQIRRREPLNKLDKGWQSRPIAIEDPFDLNHNLSSGVHKKTMIYIQKSFVQSRERFGMLRPLPNVLLDFFKRATNINHSIPEVREIERLAYIIIRSCRVGKGPPLGANCCYKCRQIGHFVNNCPQSSKGTTRELGRRSTKTQWLR